MKFRYGKYVKINRSHPQAVGICDYSGFVFNHRDLCRQMEWRGNALEWTGFLVGRPFLDVPNQQSRPPIMGPDPVPIQNPRPPQGQLITWDSNPYIWGVAGVNWDEPEPNDPSLALLLQEAQTPESMIIDNFDQGILPLPRATTLAQLSQLNWSNAG